jgi:hypothetical protein
VNHSEIAGVDPMSQDRKRHAIDASTDRDRSGAEIAQDHLQTLTFFVH